MLASSNDHTKIFNQALVQAEAGFRAANPESEAQFNKATTHLPGGNTRTPLFYSPYPLTIERGEGSKVWDVDGHGYVDFLGEYTAGICGHSHPKILAALSNVLSNGLNFSSQTRGEADFAAAIRARFPCFEFLRFTNSGTEANIMALSAARVFTKRDKIVVFQDAYHGGPLSFVGKPSVANIPFEFLLGSYNDLEATKAMLNLHAGSVAAIIIEPMLGAGGCIPADVSFLKGLRQWCDVNGTLLIFDEIMTSRLHPNGMQPALGVHADLTTMGKYLGGGMPIGVFGGRADIMSMFDPRRDPAIPHAGTFNNNVMTMGAGLAAITEIYTEARALRLNSDGNILREKLNAVCKAAGAPVSFSGIGSVMNLHTQASFVTRPSQTSQDNKTLKNMIFFDLLEKGFYIARRGLVSLNVCLTQTDLENFVDAFSEILNMHSDYIRSIAVN